MERAVLLLARRPQPTAQGRHYADGACMMSTTNDARSQIRFCFVPLALNAKIGLHLIALAIMLCIPTHHSFLPYLRTLKV